MNSNEPDRIYVTAQPPPDVQGASTTALILEIIFGFFGFLGIGHVYSGRVALGIILMVGWWVFIAVAALISSFTLGIAGCFFGPLYIAGPIISGIQARTYVQQKLATGSWSSVALVAGGGCVFLVIAGILLVILGVLSVGFLSFLGMESY